MQTDHNIFYILFIIFIVVYTFRQFFRYKDLKGLLIRKAKISELDSFFNRYFNYYNQLNLNDRKRFIKRAYNLSLSVQIFGKQKFEITEKVKLFVVAAQVQLTFGFRRYDLSIFRRILIYPYAYRSPVTGKMHYGEVNTKGIIVLSWKKLVKGHLIPDDTINLGLHELAHALMHTIIHSNDHEIGLDTYLKDIVRLSEFERKKLKDKKDHLFRSYAATNIYEFFAVAVEHFFEVPNKFKTELPELYGYMVKLLKQDPVRKVYRV